MPAQALVIFCCFVVLLLLLLFLSLVHSSEIIPDNEAGNQERYVPVRVSGRRYVYHDWSTV